MNDETPNQSTAIDEAFRFDISAELNYYQRNPIDSLDSYKVDGDFDATIRDMLIYMNDDHFDLRNFLTSPDCQSTRYFDLRRAHAIISMMLRDTLTQLLMNYSLCPLHRVDWAICFDDQDPTCDQIRSIFPSSHDT